MSNEQLFTKVKQPNIISRYSNSDKNLAILSSLTSINETATNPNCSNSNSRRSSLTTKYDQYYDDIYLNNFLTKFNNKQNDRYKRRYSQNNFNFSPINCKLDNVHNKDVLDLRSGSRASYYSQFTLNLDLPFENQRGKRIRSGSRTPNTSTTTTRLPPLDISSRTGSSQELSDRLSASLKHSKSIEPIVLPSTDNKKRVPKNIPLINVPSLIESDCSSNVSLANFMTPRGSTYQLPHSSTFRSRTGSIPNNINLTDEPVKSKNCKELHISKTNPVLTNSSETEEFRSELARIRTRKASDPFQQNGGNGQVGRINNSVYKRLLAIHENTLKKQASKSNMDFYEEDFDVQTTTDDDDDETVSQTSSSTNSRMLRSASVPYPMLTSSDRLNTIDEATNEQQRSPTDQNESQNDETVTVITNNEQLACSAEITSGTIASVPVKKNVNNKKPVTIKQPNTATTKTSTTNTKAASATTMTTTKKQNPHAAKAKTSTTDENSCTGVRVIKKSSSVTDVVKLKPKAKVPMKKPKQSTCTDSLKTTQNDSNLSVVATKLLDCVSHSDHEQGRNDFDDQLTASYKKRSHSGTHTKKVSFDQNLEVTSSKISLKAKRQPSLTTTTNELLPTTQEEAIGEQLQNTAATTQVSQKSLNYLNSMTMFYDRTETKIYEMFDNFPHPLAAKADDKSKTLGATKKFLQRPNHYKPKYVQTTSKNGKKKDGTKKPAKKTSKSKKIKKNQVTDENGTVVTTITNPDGSTSEVQTGDQLTDVDYNNMYEQEDFEAESSANESDVSCDSTTKSGVSVGDVAVSATVIQQQSSHSLKTNMLVFNNFNQIPPHTDEISQKFLYSKEHTQQPKRHDDGTSVIDMDPLMKDELTKVTDKKPPKIHFGLHNGSQEQLDDGVDNNRLDTARRQLKDQEFAMQHLRINGDDRGYNGDSANGSSMSVRSVKSLANIRKVYSFINSLKQNVQDKNQTVSSDSMKNSQSMTLSKLPPKPQQGSKKTFELPQNLSIKIHALIGNLPNTYAEESEEQNEMDDGALDEEQNEDEAYADMRQSVTIKNKASYNVSLDSVGSETVKSSNSVTDDNRVDVANNNNVDNYGRAVSRAETASARQSLLGVKNYNEFPYKWRKGHLLGRGAFGTVFQALLSTGEIIAVKEVEMEESDPSRARKDYENVKEEVNILRGLDHVNVVKFMGTSLEANIVNIFMEFIPGGTIESLLKIYGPFDEALFRNFANQILEGVHYIHSNNVVHRDIKGRNIMLMSNGIIKLIDFGCAKRLLKKQSSNSMNSTKHLLKSLKGTPYWMAPEVIRETGHGPKADIWSIGCTVFEMATGHPPWSEMKPIAAIYAIGSGEIKPPLLPEKFSNESRNFVVSCLEREQEQRPSAVELLDHGFFKMTEET